MKGEVLQIGSSSVDVINNSALAESKRALTEASQYIFKMRLEGIRALHELPNKEDIPLRYVNEYSATIPGMALDILSRLCVQHISNPDMKNGGSIENITYSRGHIDSITAVVDRGRDNGYRMNLSSDGKVVMRATDGMHIHPDLGYDAQIDLFSKMPYRGKATQPGILRKILENHKARFSTK